MLSRRLLLLGGAANVVVALLHVLIGLALLLRPDRAASIVRFFGGAGHARWGSAAIGAGSLFLAVVFMVFALYAFSAEGRFRPLPLLRPTLFAIAALYVARGLAVVPQGWTFLQTPQALPPRFLVFSLVALLIGLAYLAGVVLSRRQQAPGSIQRVPWTWKRFTQVLAGMRMPFLTGSLLPVFAAGAYVARSAPVSLVDLTLFAFAVACLHLGSNLLNDYFDTDTTDRINRYRTPFSGGSGIILNGTLSPGAVATLATSLFVLAGLVMLGRVLTDRPLLLVLGLAAGAIGALYSADPLRLASRGLGELCVFVDFGPLLTLTTGYALTGHVDPMLAVLGVVPGFLITAVLWINQFPDVEADAQAAKRNLVVRLGKARARWVHWFLMLSPFVVVPSLVLARVWPGTTLLVLLALPAVVAGLRVFARQWDDPRTIVPAQALTIASHALTTSLLLAGFLVGR
jgi:1,4-dihydroxy-2-naphthoate octaprenyltransferase